jgi:thioredoxin reductase (NADPH)
VASIIVIGDGPAGLSAALFLAKNGHETTVFAQDDTAMHYAYLHNYLGIPEISGSDFQQIARSQVREQGGELRESEAEEVARAGPGFTVRCTDGTERTAEYLVLAGGKAAQRFADQLGVERGPQGVRVDEEGRTSVDGVYAAGRLTRMHRSQAVISAGAGARVALDILAREAGKDVTDWDTPDDDG